MSERRTAVVRLRRGEEWNVKPSAEVLDGLTVMLEFGWPLTHNETSIYVGEEAWMIISHHEIIDAGAPMWLASGDLDFLPHGPDL